MPNFKKPRVNKTKKEVQINLEQIQETDRLRALIKNDVFPFLVQLNETIGYTKIFLQAAAVSIDSAFNNTSKDVKVGQFIPKMKELYKDNVGHNEMYLKFFELMKDETVANFVSLIQMTPEKMERYFMQETDKRPIVDVDIEKILG